MEATSRTPPHNNEAETGLLGSILLSYSDVTEVFERLRPEHFFSRRHQILYRAIGQLFEERGTVDMVDLYGGGIVVQRRIGDIPRMIDRKGLALSRDARRVFCLAGGESARSDFAPVDWLAVVGDRARDFLHPLLATTAAADQGERRGGGPEGGCAATNSCHAVSPDSAEARSNVLFRP